MRYDEMKRLYPWIEEYFAQVADQIHSGLPAIAVMSFLELRIGAEIQEKHQNAVIDKLTRFAHLADDNSKLAKGNNKAVTPGDPAICPYCGSIDNNGKNCIWCHNAIIV